MDNLDFQRIVSANLTKEEKAAVYPKMLESEQDELDEALEKGNVPSIIKECADVDIIAQAMQYFEISDADELRIKRSLARKIIESYGVDFDRAKAKVVESNFSKFVLENEIEAAYDHFEKLGIRVRHDHLIGNLFGMFSTKNQEVMIDGELKSFPLYKLLKSQNYFEVDESTNFWEDKK